MSKLILQTLRVERVRRFYEPLELSFDPTANLIHGPNEAGKSTLVDALQAVLFYKATSGSLAESLLPRSLRGQSGRDQLFPEITLDFTLDEQPWRVFKRFRAGAGTVELTDLQTGRAIVADAAQEQLWNLLAATAPEGRSPFAADKDFAAYGRAWPLLWVKQGRSREAVQPGEPAAEGLRGSMSDLIDQTLLPGPLTEYVSGQLRERAARYFTSAAMDRERTSADAPLHVALQRKEQLESHLAEVTARSEAYARALTDLDQTARELSDAERDLAELAGKRLRLGEQLAAAEQQMLALGQLQAAAKLAALQHQGAGERLDSRHGLETQVTTAEARAASTVEAVRAAREAAESHGQARQPLADASAAAQEQREAVLRQANRLRQQVAAGEASALVGKLTTAVAQAAQAQQASDQAAALAGAHAAFTAAALQALGQLADAERDARAKLEAVQARLVITALADGLHVQFGDEDHVTIGPDQPLARLVASDTELKIGELAKVTIRPGQSDLGKLRAAHQKALDALQQRLGELGVADAAEAGQRQLQHDAAANAVRDAGVRLAAVLEAHSAADLAALQQQLREAEGASEAARLGVASLTHADDEALPDDLTAAREAATAADAAVQAFDAARAEADGRLRAHEQQAQQLREQGIEADANHQGAVAAVDAVRDQLARHVAEHGETGDLTAQRDLAAAELARLAGELQQALAALALALSVDLRPELEVEAQSAALASEYAARQDEQRQMQAAHESCQDLSNRLRERRAALQAQLEAAEVIGLQERREELAGELDRVRAEVAGLTLERDALALLQRLVADRRQRASEAGRKPLIDAVQGLLRPWHPGARVDLDERYQLAELVRGDEAESFDELSAGAREQVNTILRLAMGTLLARRFPVFMVLGEALESTDHQRFPLLAAILGNVARELQLLMFTWNADRYRDMALLPSQKIDLAALCRESR